MGGALRRLESPHEVASFSVDLWPWVWDGDHQNSSRNGANQHQAQKPQMEPEDEEEDKDPANDLGCSTVELVKLNFRTLLHVSNFSIKIYGQSWFSFEAILMGCSKNLLVLSNHKFPNSVPL